MTFARGGGIRQRPVGREGAPFPELHLDLTVGPAGAVPAPEDFEDGAAVQEVINAVELSVHERRWVDLPLAR